VNGYAPEYAKGYLVDAEGNIDFPILGKMQVEGLKTSDVKKLIEGRIKESGYIKDPLLFVEILNFKYTVLGAVERNGTFTSDGERVTLLEAIANAGDLTSKARVDRVAVIREMGTERKMFVHDLRSTDIFSSPCFYLQQNDVVYVEPKYKKKDVEDRSWQISTFLLSLATVCTSIIWLTKN
jgi:polysaccharide export outer membrane protein